MKPAVHPLVPVALASFALVLAAPAPSRAQIRTQTVAPASADGVLAWDNTVNRMLRSDELRVRSERADTLLPGRTVQQLEQYHRGVRIWGGSLTRQLSGTRAISIFGTVYEDVGIDVTPALDRDAAKAAIEAAGGAQLGADRLPELVVLPLDDGYRLAWVGVVATAADSVRLFVDAATGAVLRRYSVRETQAPGAMIGEGFGVFGDRKKISVEKLSTLYLASDPLRPPSIVTFDMHGNLNRLLAFFNGLAFPVTSDVGSDTDNVWTDGPVVDAHVYSAYTYDYYFKRFARHGLDNDDLDILNVVHPVSLNDILTASGDVVGTFYLNAFYAGNGIMVYGEGLPTGYYLTATGQHVGNFAGALDIVAHELTHGVTEFTSNLEYFAEPGALNEAFSDIMGASVEFFFQPAGSGALHADYLIGEDAFTSLLPGSLSGIRSLANPGLLGQPDHYSIRYTGVQDNAGVHINSGIANHAFYLAIEGGTNKTSGLAVTGVGSGNREQIEKVFYRAFAELMPGNANFSLARAITLQAATDLYGAGSAPYNAVRDAWTAVGVN